MDDWEYRAFAFAYRKHLSQLDDEGKKYFNAHILPTVDMLKQISDDKILITGGYLHDTIEDTDTTYEEVLELFGKEVADLVMEVTKEGEKDHYGYYFPRLKSHRGILLKFADRLSNLSRMNAWDENRQNQYMKKSKFWKDGTDKEE